MIAFWILGPVMVLAALGIAFTSYGVNFALGAISVRRWAPAAAPGGGVGRGSSAGDPGPGESAPLRRGTGGSISPWSVAWFPVYWLLMGWAATLALYDLVRRPHHWRKTTHGVAARPGRAAPGTRRPTWR